MRILTIALVFLASCSLSAAEEVSPDTVAAKLGYDTWKKAIRSISAYSVQKVDSSKFTPEEVQFILQWARKEDDGYTYSPIEGSRPGFVLLLKFKDPKTIAYADKQLSRGWHWASATAGALENTGELSLIPMAAKYLWVDEPSEPEPTMGDVLFPGEPSSYAWRVIARLLENGFQSPTTVKKSFAEQRVRKDQLAVYRRWWLANEAFFLSGDFTRLSTPSEHVTGKPPKQ